MESTDDESILSSEKAESASFCLFNIWPLGVDCLGSIVVARFVTMACFVTKVTERVKFDALPARFVTLARFVTMWWQNVPKGPLAARFVTPSPATR